MTSGLVPADPKTTWSPQSGDCEGKTVMVIAGYSVPS
ncbi:hypothetical protein C8J47_2169 [Sphingomonas sp. PP-F2F-G114-C0414]|nr:hypothetical protein C8J47_2169 [Sphingomonas sp. PP-F2F-G114-C0414]